MKRYYCDWSLFTFLALILVLSVVTARAGTTPEVARSEGVGYLPVRDLMMNGASYETDRTPVIRAVEPDESRPYRKEAVEFARREQFAILPDPIDGRELVDRIMAVQAGEPLVTEADQLQAPRRVYQRERIGPGYVVPVCHGV
jgi:hypothetical protein